MLHEIIPSSGACTEKVKELLPLTMSTGALYKVMAFGQMNNTTTIQIMDSNGKAVSNENLGAYVLI